MKNLLNFLSLVVIASVLVGVGFGCNTTEGFGKDIKKGGENLENSANRNK